ncbi:hypothetical protein ACF0H5_004977 [Mactra antiquata]
MNETNSSSEIVGAKVQMEERVFGVLDIILFVLLFIGSAAIGFYYAYKDRKKGNVENFHRGGRKMHPIPVSLSLSATCLSALTILGNPSEVYTYGTMYLWLIFAQLVGTAVAAHGFLPVFYYMKNISCFGYVHKRFGKVIRLITSFLFLIQTLMYLGLVVYVPSLAIEAVTDISLWVCMVVMATVCTLYTTLGGMKTVVWTDNLQFMTMLVGLIALLIVGASKTGGFINAWTIANDNGRIYFTDFSVDPRTRHSVWSCAIGGAISWSYIFGIRQANVQRTCSCSTLKRAQLALWINFPLTVLIVLLTGMIGVVMYAFYHGCDPVQYGTISKNDQLVSRMVIDVLGSIPGLTGIFMACIVSGSLSSMSSALNALSATILEDLTKGLGFKRLLGWELFFSKLAVIVLGIVSFGIAVFVSQASGLVIQLSYTLFSIVSGPVLGCFIAGMFIPWINHKGATAGVLVSLVAMCWLIMGSRVNKILGAPKLPVTMNNCPRNTTYTVETVLTTLGPIPNTTVRYELSGDSLIEENNEPAIFQFYKMSYAWNTGFGMIVNLSISLLVSLMTGFTDPGSIDSDLLHPIIRKAFTRLEAKATETPANNIHTCEVDVKNGEISEVNDKENGDENKIEEQQHLMEDSNQQEATTV